jgi:poly(3-hydroxybutyrate) depolymerase
MNLVDDLNTKAEAKAALSFFMAERKRHWNDIAMIDDLVTRIMMEHDLKAEDFAEAKEKSKKYLVF